MVDYVKPLVSDALLAVGAALAVLLLWIGALVTGLSDGEYYKAGEFVKSLGMMVLTIALLVGGLIRADMDKWVRAAMIIGAILLISWVGFWTPELSGYWPF